MSPAKRVLVVDDDAPIRELLTSVLGRRDLIVDQAADGAEALDLLRFNGVPGVALSLIDAAGFANYSWVPLPRKFSGALRVLF